MKSRQQHEEFGFCGSRSHVIANGFDTHRFRPEPSKREELLKKLKLGPEATIFGTIARYHPMKNHLGLLRAAKEVLRRQQGCHFIFAGRNVDGNNKELVSLIRELGIEEHIHLQGELEDSAELIPALDAVIVPSSYGEGFPNIIGEAMSSAVPVITTDIGDSCSIVGDCGIVSRTSDPNDLAEAIVKFLTSGSISRDQLGTLSRKKVEEKFGIGLIFKKYDHLYRSLISESSKERSQDNTPTSD